MFFTTDFVSGYATLGGLYQDGDPPGTGDWLFCYELCEYEEDNPDIDIEKYVYDQEHGEWIDADTEDMALDVAKCDEITYKIEIHNNGDCPLYGINITDHMHDSVKFLSADPEPDHYQYVPPEHRMYWYFFGPLMPCEVIEIYVTAHVEGPECSYDYNWVLVGAVCEQWTYVEDEDTCWVHVKGCGIPILRPFLHFFATHPNMFPLMQQLLHRLGVF